MSSFGGRWSAAPPHGGSPSAIAKEPSHNGRRSHGLCRPGPTIRRPSLERAPRRVLRRRRSLSLELVPACESSARCLTDARRKRRFFGPRRSDRILQHETDARARPDGLPLLSRSGLAAPDSLMVIACAVPCGEPCRSTWSPGCALSSPSSLRECLAGLHTSREASSEGSPSNACSRRPRSHNLSPAKPRPSPGYPDSSRDTRWISTVAARAGGSKRRTGTFHSPVTGVFGASSPPRKPPNILVSPIADARLLEGDSPAYLDRPRPPTRATPREGWRLFDGQDVWIRS